MLSYTSISTYIFLMQCHIKRRDNLYLSIYTNTGAGIAKWQKIHFNISVRLYETVRCCGLDTKVCCAFETSHPVVLYPICWSSGRVAHQQLLHSTLAFITKDTHKMSRSDLTLTVYVSPRSLLLKRKQRSTMLKVY